MELKRNGGTPNGETSGGPLPVSEAHLTGFGASKSELKRGHGVNAKDDADDFFGPQDGGFAGRPQGWER